ncbi:MAG: hypothetical protein ABI192_06070 [Bradyrhizobium sp.]
MAAATTFAGEGKIGRLELEQLLLGDGIKVLDGLTPTLQNPLLPEDRLLFDQLTRFMANLDFSDHR